MNGHDGDGPKVIHPYVRRTSRYLSVLFGTDESDSESEAGCHVVQAGDAASSSLWHQVRKSEEECNVANDPDYAKDIACSIVLRRLGEVPSARIILYQEDPPEIWKFLR